MDIQVSLLWKLLLLITLILSQAIYAKTESANFVHSDLVNDGLPNTGTVSANTIASKPFASESASLETASLKAAASKAGANATQTDKDAPAEKHVFIIYPSDNAILSSIGNTLASNLRLTYPGIIISKTTTEDSFLKPDIKPDIVISIGAEESHIANRYFPNSNKLFISSSPGRFRAEKIRVEIVSPETDNSETVRSAVVSSEIVSSEIVNLKEAEAEISISKNNAVLYMTQPYCRQLRFIKLLNKNWNIVSLLSSQINSMNMDNFLQCAERQKIETKIISVSTDSKLTDDIKNALDQADVLLALPDKKIYNNHTVKNILLTSYRYRKPVIAFSKNFVSAGALAAIYSSTQQIGDSSSKLVEFFFENGQQFEKPINYPRKFNININKQVFTALDITLPDLDVIQQNLNAPEIQNHYHDNGNSNNNGNETNQPEQLK